MDKKKTKIVFVVAEDYYFHSHRLALARAVHAMGWEVVVVTQVKKYKELINKEGFKLIPIKLARGGQNLFRDLLLLINLIKIYWREKPTIVHHIALKPIIYGSIAAKIASVPFVVNTLAGLGYIFTSERINAKLLRPAVRLTFRFLLNRKNSRLIVQNPDDRKYLVKKTVRPDYIRLIYGSGIDLNSYTYLPEPQGVPIISFVSRMLKDKGLYELVKAAKQLKQEGLKFKLQLIGIPDPANPTSVGEPELKNWHKEGLVNWLGYQDDIAAIWRQTNIAVLPSYREGLPKALLEAAASGRAIVACDAPGCREVVKEGVNGFLVPVKDVKALAIAIRRLLEDSALRQKMGRQGRVLVEDFSQDNIVEQTISVYDELLLPLD